LNPTVHDSEPVTALERLDPCGHPCSIYENRGGTMFRFTLPACAAGDDGLAKAAIR
jgi:hypothetical protein